MGSDECKLMDLPKINDPRGNLTFLETERDVPFKFKRVCCLYDVSGGASRAGHALKRESGYSWVTLPARLRETEGGGPVHSKQPPLNRRPEVPALFGH
jgi:hypothetical protein